MTGLLYIITFITVTLLVIIIYNLLFDRKKQVKLRLNDIQNMSILSDEEEVMKQPIFERLIKPTYQVFLKFIGNIAPNRLKKNYDNIITNAGLNNKITATRLISIQIMLALLVGLFLLLPNKDNNILVAFIGIIIAFILPFSFIRTKANQRSIQIKRKLPDLLDLLYVSVEAGLAFDMALKKSADKMTGPLSDEINKALDEVSKGRNRQEALKSMANRVGVEDLSYFVTCIIQTEQLGSNIANMLRVQSITMREKRKQRAEEAAMKLPVKMLIPIIFFIFPTIFIILLGPAIMNMIDAFSNGF